MGDLKNPFERPPDSELPPSLRGYACTVVSLLPFELEEEKPHLLPPVFIIPAALDGGLGLAHIGEACHYIPHPIDERSFKQMTSPSELSRSICDDYNSAHVATSPDAGPSLFWVEGKLSAAEVMKYFPEKVTEARERLTRWYRNLVRMADADWARNKNVMAVSDLQRVAAKVLGVKKEWLDYVQEAAETINCPYCTDDIPTAAIKCPNCKEVINQEKYKELTQGVA